MRKQAILALIAGLLGGFLTRYISPPVAYAQTQPPVTKEVRAQTFAFVDPSNRTLGTLSAEPLRDRKIILNPGKPNQTVERWPDARFVLRDADGREIWSAGAQAQIKPLVDEGTFSR